MQQERFPAIQSFLGGAVLFLVLASAIALGGNRPVTWSLLAIAVLILFSGQLLLGLFNGLPLHARRVWLPAALYVGVLVWCALQLMPGMPATLAHPLWSYVPDAPSRIGADPGEGQHVLMRLIAYGMVFWIALRTAIRDDRAAWMLRAIALFCTGMAVYGIYAFFTGQNPILGAELTFATVQGTFVNRNSFATYAAFGMLANIAVAMDMGGGGGRASGDVRRRVRDMLELFFGGAWLYGIGAVLCIGALSLTQSRAGGVAGIVGLAVFLGAWRGRGRRLDPILLTTLGAVLVFVALTSATGLAERLFATEAEATRFHVYPAILSGIADRPLLGHGIGSFWEAFRPYLPQEVAVGEWVRAHNSYLENLFEMGIPAALGFYLALALVLVRIWKGTVRRRSDRAFPCFALAAAAAAAFHSFFDFSLQMPATAALFAAILGLGYAQAFSRDELKAAILSSKWR